MIFPLPALQPAFLLQHRPEFSSLRVEEKEEKILHGVKQPRENVL